MLTLSSGRTHRYAWLTLDLANQLVSSVSMEGGAAAVVTSLIEAAARAGARDGSTGRGNSSRGSGGGSISGDSIGGGGSGQSGSGGWVGDSAGTGGGGSGGGVGRGGAGTGYFEETVEFVAGVARAGLDGARETVRQTGGSAKAEEQEEACLTLLQGLSGFARSG